MKTLLCILILLCFSCVVKAHEDPLGEIYPYVSVQNDKFVVYYEKRERPEGRSEYYQATYDKNGDRIGPPAKMREEKYGLYKIWNDSEIDAALPEKLRGFVLKSGEDFLITPISSRPYFLIKKNGKYDKEDIKWGNKEEYSVHDAILTGNQVVLLITERDSTDFELLSINRQTRKTAKHLSAGVPARIYWLPISSNLLSYDGRVFVVWAEQYIDAVRLNLSSWNTVDAYILKELICDKADWNTHLSMAQIDGIALLTYHYAANGYNSVIKTLRIDLRKHLK